MLCGMRCEPLIEGREVKDMFPGNQVARQAEEYDNLVILVVDERGLP